MFETGRKPGIQQAQSQYITGSIYWDPFWNGFHIHLSFLPSHRWIYRTSQFWTSLPAASEGDRSSPLRESQPTHRNNRRATSVESAPRANGGQGEPPGGRKGGSTRAEAGPWFHNLLQTHTSFITWTPVCLQNGFKYKRDSLYLSAIERRFGYDHKV